MKRITKILLSVFILVTLMTASNAASAKSNIEIYVNGTKVESSSAYIVNGTTMVPLRSITEAFDAKMKWDAKTKTINITSLNNNVQLVVDNKNAKVNGKAYTLSVKPVVKNGNTLVPLKFVAEAFNKEVDWNSKSNKVTVHDKIKNTNIEYSKQFDIKYLGKGNKLVTDSMKTKLLLVPFGNEIPKNVKYDKLVRTPIKNALIGSSTDVSLLDAIDALDLISGVTNPIDTWEIPELKAKLKQRSVKVVGDGMTVNYESVQMLKPTMIFMTSEWDDTKKYDELGFNYVGCFGYLENTNMARLEAIRFLGAFANKDALAEQHMEVQKKKIEAVKTKVKAIKNKKKVMWGSYSSYDKAYIVAPKDSYVAEMVSFAGGDYMGKSVTKDKSKLSAEKYYLLAKDSDIMISSSMPQYGGPSTVKALVKETPILAGSKIEKSKNIWYQAPNYFQDIANTADYIEDLAAMMYPELFKSTKITHFIKMGK